MQQFLALYKKRYQILIFALIAALFVAATLCFFLLQIKRFSEKSVYVTLEAVSKQCKHEITSSLDYKEDNIGVVAAFFEEFHISRLYNDEETIIEYLRSCKKNTTFDYVFYIDSDGKSFNERSEYFDVRKYPFYKDGFEGKSSFYSSVEVPPGEEQETVLASVIVPFFDDNGNVIGLVGGTNVQSTTSQDFFHNIGTGVSSILLNGKRDVIGYSNDLDDESKIFDYLEKADTSIFSEKISRIKIGKENFYIVSDKIPQTEWRLVSIVSKSKAFERYGLLIIYSIIASLVNFFAFSAIIIAMVLIYTHHLNEVKIHAFLDPVTHGISYQKFLEDAEKYINYHESGELLAVCLDINDFRIFNDLYGFEEGNHLLKIVYRELKSYIPTGLVCRVASDTFYMITDFKATEEELLMKRELFTDAFNAMLEKIKKPYHITFTVGFYRLEESKMKVTAIFERANHVHNCAKKEGMPSFFYQEKLRQSAIKQKMIENTMHEAFENLEFQMHLQPKYELVSRRLVGAEALVRWENTGADHRYPDEFIPVFEKTGFIVQLDLYMMECTCQLLRHWIDFGIEPVPISVNQSKLLLLNPIYFNVITTTIEKYNLPPELIEVEITETIMYDNAAVLNALIANLHEYGIRVAIDDFGSGYSSLVLLRDIKADVLKIDKAFVYKAEKDLIGKKILSSIIQLADTLNMQILAEGVETENQLNMLANLGCHEVQGYLLGRPVPAQTFAQTFNKK
ncbi:MAG: GGDEF domain-containing protein [Spirochaetaceae bacterium]|nr:GGDEF domain-containing protein [Spirochaetaceae bacterium]